MIFFFHSLEIDTTDTKALQIILKLSFLIKESTDFCQLYFCTCKIIDLMLKITIRTNICIVLDNFFSRWQQFKVTRYPQIKSFLL
jgi:hypothetical protein